VDLRASGPPHRADLVLADSPDPAFPAPAALADLDSLVPGAFQADLMIPVVRNNLHSQEGPSHRESDRAFRVRVVRALAEFLVRAVAGLAAAWVPFSPAYSRRASSNY
jgi:hypothetical protein